MSADPIRAKLALARLRVDIAKAGGWDPSKHPRYGKGDPQGGQFSSNGGPTDHSPAGLSGWLSHWLGYGNTGNAKITDPHWQDAAPQPPSHTFQRRGSVLHPALDDKERQVWIHRPKEATPPRLWADPEGAVTVTPGAPTPQSLNGVAFKAWSGPAGGDWTKVEGQNPAIEDGLPPLEDHKYKHPAAGVMIVEPDGRLWLTSPTNGFGGYRHTFPKGTQEHGLTLQQTAIKEAWEETGLKIKIVGVFGDFERTTSNARYYLAQRVGGTPAKMGWESQALRLVPDKMVDSYLNMPVDRDIWKAYRQERHIAKAAPATFLSGEALASLRVRLARIEKTFSDDKHPRWPKGTPLGGQFMHVDSAGIPLPVETGTSDAAKQHLGTQQAIYTAVKNGDWAKAHALADPIIAKAESKGWVSAGGNEGHKFKAAQYGQHMLGLQGVAQQAEAKAENLTGPVDLDSYKKVSGKPGGSNPGGVYADKAGNQYLVKGANHPSNDRAMNEVLASKLMQAAGVHAPDMHLVKLPGDLYGGGLGVASKMEPLKPWTGGPLQTQAAEQDFAVHAWLANYDATGTPAGDNFAFTQDGKLFNYDPGGALLYRAQGMPKSLPGGMLPADVGEWNSMRDKSVNAAAHSVYGKMTESDLESSAQKVAAVDDKTIDTLVNTYGPGDAAKKLQLAAALKARRDDIMVKAGLADAPVKPAVAAQPAAATQGAQVAVTAAGGAVAAVSGPSTHLIHITDGHDKFWKAKVEGNNLVKTWGKNGTTGQTLVATYPSPEKAAEQLALQKASKLGKGYKEVTTIKPTASPESAPGAYTHEFNGSKVTFTDAAWKPAAENVDGFYTNDKSGDLLAKGSEAYKLGAAKATGDTAANYTALATHADNLLAKLKAEQSSALSGGTPMTVFGFNVPTVTHPDLQNTLGRIHEAALAGEPDKVSNLGASVYGLAGPGHEKDAVNMFALDVANKMSAEKAGAGGWSANDQATHGYGDNIGPEGKTSLAAAKAITATNNGPGGKKLLELHDALAAAKTGDDLTAALNGIKQWAPADPSLQAGKGHLMDAVTQVTVHLAAPKPETGIVAVGNALANGKYVAPTISEWTKAMGDIAATKASGLGVESWAAYAQKKLALTPGTPEWNTALSEQKHYATGSDTTPAGVKAASQLIADHMEAKAKDVPYGGSNYAAANAARHTAALGKGVPTKADFTAALGHTGAVPEIYAGIATKLATQGPGGPDWAGNKQQMEGISGAPGHPNKPAADLMLGWMKAEEAKAAPPAMLKLTEVAPKPQLNFMGVPGAKDVSWKVGYHGSKAVQALKAGDPVALQAQYDKLAEIKGAFKFGSKGRAKVASMQAWMVDQASKAGLSIKGGKFYLTAAPDVALTGPSVPGEVASGQAKTILSEATGMSFGPGNSHALDLHNPLHMKTLAAVKAFHAGDDKAMATHMGAIAISGYTASEPVYDKLAALAQTKAAQFPLATGGQTSSLVSNYDPGMLDQPTPGHGHNPAPFVAADAAEIHKPAAVEAIGPAGVKAPAPVLPAPPPAPTFQNGAGNVKGFYEGVAAKMTTAYNGLDKAGLEAATTKLGKPIWPVDHHGNPTTANGKLMAAYKDKLVGQLDAHMNAVNAAALNADVGFVPDPGQNKGSLPAMPEFKKIADTNTNAASHNAKVSKIEALAKAGDVKGILGLKFATNTYGKKQAALANDALAAMGSNYKVDPGQKAGAHSALAAVSFDPTGGGKTAALTAKELPQPLDFANWKGPGQGLSSKAALNAANQKVHDDLIALAKAGDLNGVKNATYAEVTADGTPTGKTLLVKDIIAGKTGSQHILNLQQSILQQMDEKLNPPKPLEIFEAKQAAASIAKLSEQVKPAPWGTHAHDVPSSQSIGYMIAVGQVKGGEALVPSHTQDVTPSFKAQAKTDYGQMSPEAHKFISMMQAGGGGPYHEDNWKAAAKPGHWGKTQPQLTSMAEAAHYYARELPPGTKAYKWLNLSNDMATKLKSAQPGLIIQNPAPMCCSYMPSGTSHFGSHRFVIINAPGAKMLGTFGSGSYASEGELSTLPNSRFMVVHHSLKETTLMLLPPDPYLNKKGSYWSKH